MFSEFFLKFECNFRRKHNEYQFVQKKKKNINIGTYSERKQFP